MFQKLDLFPCSYKKDGDTPVGPSTRFPPLTLQTRIDLVFEMLLICAFWSAKQ